jgi:hypothetical protein
MHRFTNHVRFWVAVGAGTLIILIVLTTHRGETFHARAEAATTPTPYHEGVPSAGATPHAMEPSLYPLPSPEDRASVDAMTAGSVAMIHMAQIMDEAATLLLAASDAQLVDLSRHWAFDAQALRQQAAWMVLSATAADMIHDPATAHELNARNLKGNSMAMTAEGRVMAEHGRAMTAQVEQLREAGALPPDLADQLEAAGAELIATGAALERDGQQMEESADLMLELIGQ